MEVVGGVASIVGIAQALAATPKIVAAIRAVAERKEELSKLLKEVERLSATCQQIHDITRLLSQHLPDNVVAMLHAAEEDLKDTVLELEKFGDKCTASTRAQRKDMVKANPNAVRWLWMRPQLQQLYSRTRDTGNNLQMVLQLAHSHILHRMLTEGLHNATISAIVGFAPRLPEVPAVGTELEADSDSLPPSPDPEQELKPQPSGEDSISDGSIVASASLANDTTTDADQLQVTPLGFCSPGCQCRCHRHGSRASVWRFSGLQESLGALRVSHAPRAVQCDIPSCAREGASAPLEVQYLFPTWLYAGIWSISASVSSLTGLGSKIQFTHGRFLPRGSWFSHYAYQGTPADLQALLSKGEVYYPSDLTTQWPREASLMELAMSSFNIAVVEFLLQYWSPIFKQTGVSRRTAALAARCLRDLGPAVSANEASILRRVVESYPDWSFLARAPEIHTAVGHRDQKLLQTLLDQDPSLKDSTDPRGCTPLHIAAEENNLEAIRTLSKAGADKNIRDGAFDMTPLGLALERGHCDCAGELIASGAVIPDNALHLTVMSWRGIEHQSLVDTSRKLLLRKPSLAHHRDGRRMTILHRYANTRWKSEQPSILMVQLLLEAGADVEAKDDLGDVPLGTALSLGNLGIASALMEGGARIANAGRSKLRQNLLHAAAIGWTAETVQFFRDKTGDAIDLDVEQRDTDGDNPWDTFVTERLSGPRYRKRGRRPDQASVTAFVDLFTVCRNRAIKHEIAVLANVLRALEQRQADEARAILRPLEALKESQDRDVEVQTLHAIEVQIREGMWEAAQESVEERIVVVEEEMETSPWQRETDFDWYLYRIYSKDELIALRGGMELERDDAYFCMGGKRCPHDVGGC